MRPFPSHNLRKAFGCFFLTGLFFTPALHAQSVVLQLRNGDRLSGKIISETTNRVVLTTPWATEIAVPLAEIKSREIIPAPLAQTTNPPVPAKTNAAPEKVAALPSPKAPEKPKPPQSWHGDAQIGTDVSLSATKRELYYGRFKIIYAPMTDPLSPGGFRRIDRFRNTFDFNAAYGKTDGLLSANHMEGSSKTDFDLGQSRRFFAYNLVGAGYDEIRKIDLRYEVGPGVGYHVITQSNFVFNTEVGMNYQVQHLRDSDDTERFFYRFAEDFTWKISKKLTFDEKLEFFPQVNLQDYRFRFETNLRYWFLESFSFALTLVDIYDTQPASGIGRNDLQIRSTLGVKF